MSLKDSEERSSPHFNLLTHPNGTKTFVDVENGQAMHSRIGPEEEADAVYGEVARVEDFLGGENAAHVLYDVGMGVAANIIATLRRIRNSAGACGLLRIYSFETKPWALTEALHRPEDFPFLVEWKERLEELVRKGATDFLLGGVRVEWRLRTGDFFVEMDSNDIPPPNTIYYDFYSPRAVPELWTREKFQALRKKIGSNPCRLYTYAAATLFRMNLLLAGFYIGRGAPTRAKFESTSAANEYSLLAHPLDASWLKKLDTSNAIRSEDEKREIRNHPQWKI